MDWNELRRVSCLKYSLGMRMMMIISRSLLVANKCYIHDVEYLVKEKMRRRRQEKKTRKEKKKGLDSSHFSSTRFTLGLGQSWW